MMKTCLKCGYTRSESDSAPEYECPKCGRVYAKVEQRMGGAQRYPSSEPADPGAAPGTLQDDQVKAAVAAALAREKAKEKANKSAGVVLALLVAIGWGGWKLLESRQSRLTAERNAAAEQARRAEWERKLAQRREAEEREAKDPVVQARKREEKLHREAESNKIEAMTYCDAAIKRTLNDPNSAEFDSIYSDMPRSGLSGNTYQVKRGVRAKNAFGAYIYTTFFCTVDVVGGKPIVRSVSQARR